jgi:two-component system, OmpR family, response regulator
VPVVEDDRKIAAAVKRGLQGEGFSVEVAADGVVGLWRATEGIFDLVVLNIMLPGRNGFEISRPATGDPTPRMRAPARSSRGAS